MAGSRREKLGSVFSRLTGLLKSGALKEEDRPIWYDVVKAFPPKHIQPQKQVQAILYPEDFIRVHFYRTFIESSAAVLTNEKIRSVPQRFVDKYLELQSEKAVPVEQLFDETVRILKEEGVKFVTHQEKEAAEKTRRESFSLRKARDGRPEEDYSGTVIDKESKPNEDYSRTIVQTVREDRSSQPPGKTSQGPAVNLEDIFKEKR